MLKKTSIEWTDFTWNPVTGCDRISAGCDHCYALTMARRLKAMGLSLIHILSEAGLPALHSGPASEAMRSAMIRSRPSATCW